MLLFGCIILFPYFLYASIKGHNSKHHPSAFWYNIVPLMSEFAIICSLICICAYYLKYCEHSYYVIPFILLFIGIAFILALDLVHSIADTLSYDLQSWMRSDLHKHRIPISGDSYLAPYISLLAKDMAYLRHEKLDKITNCHICLEPFDEEPEAERVILRCGHVFHGECINHWEQSKWTQDQYIPPFCRCPECRRWYHAKLEKFEYDENHKVMRGFYYPGKPFIEEHFWKRRVKTYKEYRATHLV